MWRPDALSSARRFRYADEPLYGEAMRRPLTSDDVAQLYVDAQTPEDHRATAAQLAVWAAESHSTDRGVSSASLLVSAAEHLERAGDLDEAVKTFRRAVQAGQHVPPDVRCFLHSGLLKVGDGDAARELADELRRERPIDGDVYLFVGENYELAGDLREAHRWLTLGARRTLTEVEDGDEDFAEDAAGLLAARLRVRRALGQPLDEYDRVVASALLARHESGTLPDPAAEERP